MKFREAAVAGRFYPAKTTELTCQLDKFFETQSASTLIPKALIVPHAGYFYSGETAAMAYKILRECAHKFSRVALLGPNHHVALEGCAIPDSDWFVTPMGDVELDKTGMEHLLDAKLAVVSEKVHHWEHSLEVQLPFLQYCLNDFTLLPIVVGRTMPETVKHILEYVEQQPNTLIVVSSDLSHYHPYNEANDIDFNTIENILSLHTDVHPQQACGCHSINGLLEYAKSQMWNIKCIRYTNSGDVLARYERRNPSLQDEVVGYASFILY